MSKKSIIHTSVLKDHYGQVLNVGDLVLGARAGNRFKSTVFNHAIVIGRTKCMIRLHQLTSDYFQVSHLDPENVKAAVGNRGHRGGKVHPTEVIKLRQLLTEQEVLYAVKLGEEAKEKQKDDFSSSLTSFLPNP